MRSNLEQHLSNGRKLRQSRNLLPNALNQTRTFIDENGSIAALNRTELELRQEIGKLEANVSQLRKKNLALGVKERGNQFDEPIWGGGKGKAVRSELEVLQSIQKIDRQLEMMGGKGRVLDFGKKSEPVKEKRETSQKTQFSKNSRGQVENGEKKERHENHFFEGRIYNSNVADSSELQDQTQFRVHNATDFDIEQDRSKIESHWGLSHLQKIDETSRNEKFGSRNTKHHPKSGKNKEILENLVSYDHQQVTAHQKNQNASSKNWETQDSATQNTPNNWDRQEFGSRTGPNKSQAGVLSALKDNKSEDFSAMLDGEIRALESRQREIDEERRRLINGKMGKLLISQKVAADQVLSKKSNFAKNRRDYESNFGAEIGKENLAKNIKNFDNYKRESEKNGKRGSFKVSQVRGRPSRLPPVDQKLKEEKKKEERESSVELLREARAIIANFRKKRDPSRILRD